jgi:hypothetical protein
MMQVKTLNKKSKVPDSKQWQNQNSRQERLSAANIP